MTRLGVLAYSTYVERRIDDRRAERECLPWWLLRHDNLFTTDKNDGPLGHIIIVSTSQSMLETALLQTYCIYLGQLVTLMISFVVWMNKWHDVVDQRSWDDLYNCDCTDGLSAVFQHREKTYKYLNF